MPCSAPARVVEHVPARLVRADANPRRVRAPEHRGERARQLALDPVDPVATDGREVDQVAAVFGQLELRANRRASDHRIDRRQLALGEETAGRGRLGQLSQKGSQRLEPALLTRPPRTIQRLAGNVDGSRVEEAEDRRIMIECNGLLYKRPLREWPPSSAASPPWWALRQRPHAARPTAGPPPSPSIPRRGIPWQDLYFANFVDLDPGPVVLDWNCGTQTDDGHTGEDSIIRSFQEKRIGVPVFAAIDGTVIDVSDLLPDEHTADTMTPVDNHVIISSRNMEIRTVYGHLRKNIPVRVGQHVVAGQQLGYTASSGHSSWPHLHFTAKLGFEPY